MPAAITRTRVYKDGVDDSSLPRDVSEDMLLLEPDQTPLLVFTGKNKRKEGCDSPKFEWFEKSEVPVWDLVAATVDYATTDTSIKVADVSLWAVGDCALFPVAPSSGVMDELTLVTVVGTNAITITRGIGGTTPIAIGSTQSVRIMGGGLQEGGDIPTVRSKGKTNKYSYTSIFRTPVDVSRTQQATKSYGAPSGTRKELLMEALARHKQEIEAAGLWSAASETQASTGTIWTTQGYKATVSSNITNGGGTFTLTKYNDYSETAFRYGAAEKLLMAAPKFISACNYFSQNKLLTSVGSKVFGVAIARMLANGFGEFLLANNFRMGDLAAAGKYGFDDEAYSIDLPSVSFRYLNGNGESQDTKLYQDEKKDGKARNVDEYYSQVGWQIRHEKKHSRLHNVTSYA